MGSVLQGIRSFDISIYYYLSRFADNWILVRLAGLEESNDLIKGASFFALYWYVWFRRGTDQERRRTMLLTVPFAAVISIIVTRIVAVIAPFRVRPMDNPALIHPVFPADFHYNLEHWSSFPSDTAAYFFVLAFGVAYLSRRLAIPVVLYTAIWVCLTRIYLGIHYASDVVVGAMIGSVVAWLSLKSNLLRSLAARPARVAETRPQLFYPVAFICSFEMASVFEGLRDLGNRFTHFVGIGLHIGFLRTGQSHSIRPIDTWGGLLALVAFAAAAVWAIHAMSGSVRKIFGLLGGVFEHYCHPSLALGKKFHPRSHPTHS